MIALAGWTACGNPAEPAGPETRESTVLIIVHTSGAPVDPDGYTLGGVGTGFGYGTHLQPTDSAAFTGRFCSSCVTELVGVATNCRVDAPNPRTFVVRPGDTTRVLFVVECARGGAVSISASFDGYAESGFTYSVSIGGIPTGSLGARRPFFAADLFPGTHHLLLNYLAGFCELEGPASRDVQVASDDTVALSVRIHCPIQPDTTYTFLIERADYLGGGVLAQSYELVTQRGSRSRTFTPPGVMDIGPTWSPDGTRIAFFSDRSGTQALYVMSSDGTQVLRLADAAPYWRFNSGIPAVAWSPDGRMLATTGQEEGRIRLIQADGSGERSVQLGWNTNSLSWSPDSRQFVTDHDGDIVIVNVETGAVQPITAEGGGGQPGNYPLWSPRGDRIAWFSVPGIRPSCDVFTCGPIWGVWLADGEGGSPHGPAVHTSGLGMAWSPRGSLLALFDDTFGAAGVYDPATEVFSKAVAPSTPDKRITLSHGAWAPDEQHVVYWSHTSLAAAGVEIVTDRLVGGGERRVIALRPSINNMKVSWRPGSR